MHLGSLLLLAFLGPARGLFLPVEGTEPMFQTVEGGMILTAGGMQWGATHLRIPEPVLPEGVVQEGGFRFVGEGKDRRVPAYRTVRWKTDHLEVRLTGLDGGGMELQFWLPAGVSPEHAYLEVEHGRLIRTREGVMLLRGVDTVMYFTAFRAYQGVEERALRLNVQPHRLTFEVLDWDPRLPLVIDPITAVVAASDTVVVRDVKVSPDGNSVYAAGDVYGFPDVNFSVGPVVYGTTNSPGCVPDCWDAFVTHLSADLAVHHQTVVFAGAFNDHAMDLAVESTFVAVAGWTESANNFSVNRTLWGTPGGQDAYVVVMDTALSTLLHTLIVATPDTDQFWAVDFDEYAHIYAGGFTRDGASVPSSTAPHIFGTVGNRDAFVVSLSMDPTPTLMASSVLGGTATSDEELDDLIKEPQGGSLYVTGQTTADSSFAGGPPSPGWGYSGPLGGYDAFLARLTQSFAQVSTWVLGTADDEFSRRLAPDAGWQHVYMAGFTRDVGALTGLQMHLHGPVPPPGVGGSFVIKASPSLTPVDGAVLTGASGNGAQGLVVHGDRVVLAGKVYDPQSFAPSRRIYGPLGGPDAYVSVLDTTLMVHLGSAVLASPGYDQAGGVDVSSLGWVLGGMAGAPAQFAENPPSYVYGTGTAGPRGFVSLLPFAQVEVAEATPNRPEPSRLRLRLEGPELQVETRSPGYLALKVLDGQGRQRALRVWGFVRPGTYRAYLDLPSGVYLLTVRSGQEVRTQRMVLP